MPKNPPIPPITNFPKNWLTLIVLRGLIPRILHFPMLPETFMALKKYLITITPTLDGGFVDDFGRAPSPFTLTGTFGYNQKGFKGVKPYTGYGWLKYLEWIVDESHKPDDILKTLPEVWLLSWVSDHYYKIKIIDLNISETVNRNMLWVYALKITALQPLKLEIPLVDDVFNALKNKIVSYIPSGISTLNVTKELTRIVI